MKFARFSRSLLEITRFRSPNGFHSNFYSTKAMPKREGSPAELYRRISPVGDPNISIVPILDQWVEEGRSVDEQALNFIIGNLWKHKRHSHALEVSRWMSEKADFELSSWHAAIRLQSIFKAQGMEQTEKYFNSLSQKQKGLQVYCGLLKCYASSQCVEKAEAVMGEMKDLGYAKKATEYNLMFNLYYKTRNMKKFDDLLQEMEEKGIVHNECTLAILFSAYAAVKDIEKMDKIVTKMESDPKLAFNWTNYTNTAACYEKAGLLDNAFEMLKKAEACLTSETCINAYDTILRQYATVGKKDEVLRFWSFYKKKCKVNNHGYICILSSLLKLGDFEMAEEIFYEWESRDDLTYDMNIPNSIIAAYSKKGLIEKAEALIDRAISKGGKPNNWTWYCLVRSYLENEQPEKAVEMMKKAIVNSKPGWKPDMALVEACLEYSKGVGDNEQIEEFANLLQVKGLNIASSD